MAKQKTRQPEPVQGGGLLDELEEVDREVHGAVSAEDANPWRERAKIQELREAAYLGSDQAWEAVRDRLSPADRQLIEAQRQAPAQSARVMTMKRMYRGDTLLPGAAGRIIEGGYNAALQGIEQAMTFGIELAEQLPTLGASERRAEAAAEHRRELGRWSEAQEMALDALAEEGTERKATDTFSRPWIEKQLRGAVRSISQVTLSGHPAVAIAGFSASEAASAANEADRLGLEGAERAKYIAGQAAIEATPATIMSMLGFSGGEKIVGYPIRRLLAELVGELGEELTTEVAHELFRRYTMDELNSMTADDLKTVVIDTTAQTVLTVGAMSGPTSAAQHIQARRQMRRLVGGDDQAQAAAFEWLSGSGYIDPETGDMSAAGKRLFDKQIRRRDADMVAGVEREGDAMRQALARFSAGGEISGTMADRLLRIGWVDDSGALTNQGQRQLERAEDPGPAATVPESEEEKTAALLDLGYGQTDIDAMLQQSPAAAEEVIAKQQRKWSPEPDATVTRRQAVVAGIPAEVMVVGEYNGQPLAVDGEGRAYTLAEEMDDADEAALEEREPQEETVANALPDWAVDTAAIDRHVRRARRQGRITRQRPAPAPEAAQEPQTAADTAEEVAQEATQEPAEAQEAQEPAEAVIITPKEAEDATAVRARAEGLGLQAEIRDDGSVRVVTQDAPPWAVKALRGDVASIADVAEEARAQAVAPAEAAEAAAADQEVADEAPAAGQEVTAEEVAAAGARQAARQAASSEISRRIKAVGENPVDGADVLTAIAAQGGIATKPKGHRGGEYDGQPSLPGNYKAIMNRTGGLMPDQMAQILSDRNILDNPNVHELWAKVEAAIKARQSAKQQAEEMRQGPPAPEDVDPADVDRRAEVLTEEELQAFEDDWDGLANAPFSLDAAVTDRFRYTSRVSLAKIAKMVGDNGRVRREVDGSISIVAKSGERINWVAREAPAARPDARGALAAAFRDADGVLVAQVAIYPNAIEGTYGHELVHALRQLGLITDAEYQRLVYDAKQLGLDAMLDPYREAYEARGYDEGQMQAALDDELAAIYVEKMSMDAPEVQPRWWQRLQRWFVEAGAAVGLYPTPEMTGWQTAREIMAGGLYARERSSGELEPDLEGMRWSLPEDGEAKPRQLEIFTDHMQTSLFDEQVQLERDVSLGQDAPEKDVRAHRLLVDRLPIEMGPNDTVSALAQDYFENRTPSFDVRGKSVVSSLDAAVLFSMLRSPFVERLRWMVTNADGVVTASQIHGVGTIGGTDASLDPVNARAAYLAADEAGPGASIWISHNHPSGDPTPSPVDNRIYQRAIQVFRKRGVKCNVMVTNGDRYYARLHGEDEMTERSFPDPTQADYENVPFAQLGMKVTSPEKAAHAATLVANADSAAVAVYVDSRSIVRALSTFTSATTRELNDGLMRESGSGQVIVTSDAEYADVLMGYRGEVSGLLDVIVVRPDGTAVSMRAMEPGKWEVGENKPLQEPEVLYAAMTVERAPDGTPLTYDDAAVDARADAMIEDGEFFADGLEGEGGEDVRFSLPEDQGEAVERKYPNDDPPMIETWAKKHRIANLGRRGNKLTFSWVGRDGTHRVTIQKNLVPASIIANLKEFNGTPFAAAALKSLEARAAVHEAINSKAAKVSTLAKAMPKWLRAAIVTARADAGAKPPTVKAAARALLDGMIQTAGGVLSSPTKPELAVPGSYINCTPTKECAWKCFATRNMRQTSAPAIYRSEAMDVMAQKIPDELGSQIAREFKTTRLYNEGYALRFYDRGEGHNHWVRVVEAINREGVRVHVFSKNPGFLAKIDPKNVRLLSADRSNVDAAKKSGLPLAFIWQDAKDADALRSVRDKVQCLLPIMQSGKVAGKDIAEAKKILGTRNVICPVDAGDRTVGAAWHYDPDSNTHTCARCDKEGIGCYFKQTTRKAWGEAATPQQRIAEIVRIAQEEGISNAEAQAIARRISAEILGWDNQTATGNDPGSDETDVSRATRTRDSRSRSQKKNGRNRRDDPDVKAWSLPEYDTHSANPRYFVTRTQQLIEDESMPEKATGDEMFRFLLDKGVNKRELFWLGLDELEGDENQWTRDQVQALVQETEPIFDRHAVVGPSGETEYLNYFPIPTKQYQLNRGSLATLIEDKSNYQETVVNLLSARDGHDILGRIYNDEHRGDETQPILYHTRSVSFLELSEGKHAYYLGEIQSDWAQERQGYQDRGLPGEEKVGLSREAIEFANGIEDNTVASKDIELIGYLAKQYVVKNESIRLANMPQYRDTDVPPEFMRLQEARMEEVENEIEFLKNGLRQDNTNEDAYKYIFWAEQDSQGVYEIWKSYRDGEPFQKRKMALNPLQKTWVRHALLRELKEAVYQRHEYFAWSAGPEIAAASHGDPKIMREFYGGTVTRTARKILRKIAPEQDLTTVDLGFDEPNPAIEITPKVVQAVLEGDMPLAYALPERDVLQQRAPAHGTQRTIGERLAAAADRATTLEADDAHFSLPENRKALQQLSADPEANERMLVALAAKPKEQGILEWLKEKLVFQWKMFRNTFGRLDEAKFPQAIEEIKILQSRLESSVIRAWRIQNEWFGKLSQAQQVDFTVLTALPDLIRTLEDDQEGLYCDKPGNIPFYGRGDEETRSVAEIREQVVNDYRDALKRADPQVRRALEERTDWHRDFVAELVNYGLLPRDVMEDDRYFHRIVLKHMEGRRIAGGKAGMRQRKVSAQRKRTGGGDFSLDYTLSETQYIAEMLTQMAKVDCWARLDAQYGIKESLKQQAETLNYDEMQRRFEERMGEALQEAVAAGAPAEILGEIEGEIAGRWDFAYRQKMAINFQYLLKLVATGDLSGTPFADFEAEAHEAYQAWLEAMAEYQELTEDTPRAERPAPPRLEVDHPSFWAFVHYIASGQHGPITETLTMSGKPMENPRDVNPQLNALAIFKAMAEKQREMKEELGNQYQTWKGLAMEAEDHSIIQPEKGLLFAPGFTIQESALTALLTQSGQAVEEDVLSMLPDVVPVESRNIRRGRILVGPKPEFVWPTALVETIEDLDIWYRDVINREKLYEEFSRAWKKGILFGPWRWAKYETRNAFSDIDVALTNPGILLEVPEAARDMAKWSARSRGQAMASGATFGALLGLGIGFAGAGPLGAVVGGAAGAGGLGYLLGKLYGSSVATKIEMERWEDYQVFSSGQLLNEVGQLDVERSRELVEGRNPGLIARYFSITKHFNLWREGVLRLAAARHMLKKLKTDGRGVIERRIYVASRRDVMDALYDQQAQLAKDGEHDQAREMKVQIAAKLSRELLGDYGSISERGRWLRRTLGPFWSWQEINLPRYVRLFKNAPYEGQHRSGTNRRRGLVMAAIAGKSVLRVGTGALAFTIMVRAWNASMRALLDIDDEEDPNQSGRGHFIIVGRDADGEIQNVSIAGALQDAAGWVGLDNWAEHHRKIERADFRGETWKGVKEVAGDMAFAPVQRGADLLTPWIKVPAEQAAGQQYFPDVRDPRALKDRWAHLFSAAGLKEPYMAWSRRASPEELFDTLTYSFNPGASAYWQAKGLAWDYQERQGKTTSGTFLPKEHTWCLSQAKSAWQMEDRGRADYWLMRYFQAGGNLRKYAASRRSGHPLRPVAQKNREKFWAELDERDRSYVRLGIAWWEEQGGGSPEFNVRVREVYDRYQAMQDQ